MLLLLHVSHFLQIGFTRGTFFFGSKRQTGLRVGNSIKTQVVMKFGIYRIQSQHPKIAQRNGENGR